MLAWTVEGSGEVLCELTLRKGQVAWDLNGLASVDAVRDASIAALRA